MNMLHDFGVNKVEKLKRSTWGLPLRSCTSFKQGVLFPFAWTDVIPGSTIKASVDSLIRLGLTPKVPFFNDMYFTYGAYFVPYRVLFQHYPDMFGNGKPSEWSDPQEFVMPTFEFLSATSDGQAIRTTANGYDAVVNNACDSNTDSLCSVPGNLLSYLGLPHLEVDDNYLTNYISKLNLAPVLAYERIWSDFWRDENYQNVDPDLEVCFNSSSGDVYSDDIYCCLHYANKFHDYFTSMLPDTQKGVVSSVFSPLDVIGDVTQFGGEPILTGLDGDEVDAGGLNYAPGDGVGVDPALTPLGTGTQFVGGSNLGTTISIPELRMAVQLQRAYERNARTGSRSMNEAMHGIFEANAPSVLNQAEFLGGNTIRLNLMSVPQTDATAPGKLGAFSATNSSTGCFEKTFNEPGILMFVGTVRIRHNYTQGIDKYWFKKRRYDFYDPALAHISEQPVYARELNAASRANYGIDVIGFNEAWVEYVKPVNKITGYLADASSADLSAWALQDRLANNVDIDPTVFYQERGNEVARACVNYNSSYDSFQFIGDLKANLTITACKPVNSIPGYIDHLIA